MNVRSLNKILVESAVPSEKSVLSGYDPVLSYSLLAATRSINTSLYRSIVRETSVTIDSVSTLIDSGRLLGDMPLLHIIGIIRESSDYDRIVKLAGMEAFHRLNKDSNGLRGALSKFVTVASRTNAVRKCAEAAAELTTLSAVSTVRQGSSYQVELSASPFANCTSDRPMCGFYSTFLSTSVSESLAKTCMAEEVSCASMTSGLITCVFILSVAD